MVFAVGYSYKSVDADNSSPGGQVTDSGYTSGLKIQADIDTAKWCRDKQNDYQKYKDGMKENCPSGNDKYCEDQAKNCAAGYAEKFEKAQAAAEDKLKPPKKDDLDDVPDPDAKVPQEGDPEYCKPNGEDVGKKTNELTKKPAAADSTTSSNGSKPDNTPTPTECETASLNDQMNTLDSAYREDKAKSIEKQNDYLTAVQQTQADQAKCSKDLEAAKSQLATLQGQAAALPSQEQRAISGQSVGQQASIQEAQAAQVAAQRNVDMIKAKATSIETDYANQLSAALTACYGNLQTLAGANSLNRGSSLNQALGQAQGGITSNKCQTNFIYQQASARAWRVYITQLQQNQADYMAAQAQVDLAYAHIKTVQYAGTQKDADTIQAFAEKHQALGTGITSANSALTSQGNVCTSQTALDQAKEKTAMQPATDAADRARLEYCQEQYLKKTYGGHTTGGKKDALTDRLKDLHKALFPPVPNPCDSLPCSDTKFGVCTAPAQPDKPKSSCDGPNPRPPCQTK